MVTALFLLLGLLAGAAGTWWVQRNELTYLRDELRVAQDRLLHAWHKEAIIPPRPQEIEPVKPLPPELQAVVNDWDSPESRAAMDTKLRRLFFDQGQGIPAILKQLENEHP